MTCVNCLYTELTDLIPLNDLKEKASAMHLVEQSST